NPNQIVTQISGASQISLDAQGNLVIQTSTGNLVEHAPLAYQDVNGTQRAVSSQFVLLGNNEVGIQVGPYDRSKPLVIDPNWVYSSYLGGSGTDEANGIAVSPMGFVGVVGSTTAAWNPGGESTVTTIKPGNGGRKEVFVAGIDAGGQTVNFITY